MNRMFEYLKVLESFDIRQKSKVLHKLSDIAGISLFAMIANGNSEKPSHSDLNHSYCRLYRLVCFRLRGVLQYCHIFAKVNEDFLCEYFELSNGIPSHDTI